MNTVNTETKAGDYWALGDHILLCGDSTNAGDVAALMNGVMADMVFTDPPYNLAGKSKNFAANAITPKVYKRLKNSTWDKDFDIAPALARISENLAQDATVYVCTSHFLAPAIWDWMSTWATYWSYCVWSKTNPMPSLSKRHWTWNTELICYATRGKHIFNFPEKGHALSTWKSAGKHGKSICPAQKPVCIPEYAIFHSSNEGQVVLDLFGGSGSTLIACEKTRRKCRMMEISPQYCDAIVYRWEEFTGRKAERGHLG